MRHCHIAALVCALSSFNHGPAIAHAEPVPAQRGHEAHRAEAQEMGEEEDEGSRSPEGERKGKPGDEPGEDEPMEFDDEEPTWPGRHADGGEQEDDDESASAWQ